MLIKRKRRTPTTTKTTPTFRWPFDVDLGAIGTGCVCWMPFSFNPTASVITPMNSTGNPITKNAPKVEKPPMKATSIESRPITKMTTPTTTTFWFDR